MDILSSIYPFCYETASILFDILEKFAQKMEMGLCFFINLRYLLLKNFIFLNATKIRLGKYTVHQCISTGIYQNTLLLLFSH